MELANLIMSLPQFQFLKRLVYFISWIITGTLIFWPGLGMLLMVSTDEQQGINNFCKVVTCKLNYTALAALAAMQTKVCILSILIVRLLES